MPSPVRLCLIVSALLLVAAPAPAQSLFDFLTGGGRSAAPPSSPPPPAAAAQKSTAPRSEAKKKKSAAPKSADRVQRSPVGAAAPPATAADAPAAPYEAQTLRLSEILGALAFLRDLCAAGDGEDWRNKMTALLEAEAPSGPKRDKYVSAFNRGFRGYELTYRSCTPNARAAIARYLDEANRIAADLAYRYGGA
jgi:uncharacterized protein (TIGR02301 family)